MSATELQAGRELDALVAEKVMGWTYLGERWSDTNHSGYQWRDSTGTRHETPPFSTDIAAAWEALERMASVLEDVAKIEVSRLSNGQYACVVGAICCEFADTPALAICRAALAAVGGA
jgi:hypothetical protein